MRKDFYLVMTNAPGVERLPDHRIDIRAHVQAAEECRRSTAAAQKFFNWALAKGQPQALSLDYVPLPGAAGEADPELRRHRPSSKWQAAGKKTARPGTGRFFSFVVEGITGRADGADQGPAGRPELSACRSRRTWTSTVRARCRDHATRRRRAAARARRRGRDARESGAAGGTRSVRAGPACRRGGRGGRRHPSRRRHSVSCSPASAGRTRRSTAPSPGDQLARAERLGHIIVGAGLEAANAVSFLAARGQHDDRNVGGRRAAAQAAADFDAADALDHPVEEDDVGLDLIDQDQRLLAVAGPSARHIPPARNET